MIKISVKNENMEYRKRVEEWIEANGGESTYIPVDKSIRIDRGFIHYHRYILDDSGERVKIFNMSPLVRSTWAAPIPLTVSPFEFDL
jgi:hypothetical protein